MKTAHPLEIKKVCNGCGTEGWKGKLVPDSVYGLTITAACQPHDWMYYEGETDADKKIADRVFLNNMVRIVKEEGGLLEWLRLRRVKKYYLAVKYFGGDAFWAGKNKPEEEVEADTPFFDFEDD